MKFLCLLSGILLLYSCSNLPTDKKQKPKMDAYSQISYHFRDSSVPPRYHRSFRINVTPGESHVVVDSYGDVLADTTVKLEEGVWGKLLGLTEGLQGEGSYTASGATGTKGYSLKLYENGKQVYNLYWDSLSKDSAEETALELKKAIMATIPNLAALTH